MNNPEYAKIGDKKYKINTDFRTAIECNEIATNNNIGEYEKSLAVIYKLFGEDGLNDRPFKSFLVLPFPKNKSRHASSFLKNSFLA